MNAARNRIGIGRRLTASIPTSHDAVAVGLREVRVDVHHLLEHVEIGSEDRGRAVQEHHVLHEQHQLFGHPRAVGEQLLGDVAHLGHQVLGRHLGRVLHRRVEPEIVEERVEIDVGRERAEIAQRGELAALVAGGAEEEQPHEREALPFAEPTGHAEVEQRGAPVGLHHEVAAVQIAVEDAVDHRPLERRDEAGLEQRVGVDAGRVHRLDVVEREPAEPFHHQHPLGDEGRMRTRNDHGALVRLREHVRDVEHVLGFEAEIELLDDRLREQFDQRGRIGQRGDGDPADELRREPRERGDVVAEELRDPRSLHLDHDLLAGDKTGSMDLRDRRGRDRRFVEPLEEVAQRGPEVDLDDGAHIGERLRRHLVAQELELVDQLVGKQPSPPEMIWPSFT